MGNEPREIPRWRVGDHHLFDDRIVVNHQRPIGRLANVQFHPGDSERSRLAKGVRGCFLSRVQVSPAMRVDVSHTASLPRDQEFPRFSSAPSLNMPLIFK